MDENQELRSKVADYWWELERQSLEYSKEYGAITLRGLFIINGGAILAILALIGSILQSKDVIEVSNAIYVAIWMFSVGLVLSILSAAIGYINFQALNHMMPGPAGLRKYIENGDTSSWKDSSVPTFTARLAVFIAFVSTAMFFAGIYFSIVSFQTMLGSR